MREPEPAAFSIRPAVPEDVDVLAAIDAICFPPGIAYPRREIAALVRAPNTWTLVAEHAGKIAGFTCMGLRQGRSPGWSFSAESFSGGPSSTGPLRGELITIEILVEFRRAGLGWRLHQGLEEWLRSAGGGGIELHVAVDNAAAIAFYERLGYRTVARVRNYYLHTMDAWRMEKRLK